VGAALELLAYCAADRVDAVGHVRELGAHDLARAQVRLVAGRVQVAVPTGLAQHSARAEDAGAADESRVERFLEAAVKAAGVSHGGETAKQHALEHLLGFDAQSGGRALGRGTQVEGGDDCMHMGIDQPWHQCLALGVDMGVFGYRGQRPAGGYFDNPVAGDPDG